MNLFQRYLLLAAKFVCAAATAFLAVSAANADTLTGTVTSAGHAVAGANVRLLELDRVQHTGDAGRFVFTDVPKGSYHVFVSAIGHASATQAIDVAGDAAASFEIKTSAIRLEEIVVSASPYARTADDQYQSAESKSLVGFLNTSGASFAEKLSDLPGVAVRGLGSAPSRPVLRGLSDNRVLVLENGLRNGDISTYDPAHATPLEAVGISQVDVVRGPASILYGPSTIGGLVNVITNLVPTVADRHVSGTVTAEGNSVSDQYSGFFRTVLSGAHSAFSVSAGGLHANDTRIPKGTYLDPATGAAFDLERLPQTFDHSGEAGAGYAYQGAVGTFGIGYKHYEMNYGITGTPTNPDWVNVPPATSRIFQRRNTVEMHSRLNGGQGGIKQWHIDANYNDYNHAEYPTAQDSTGISDPEANHFHKRTFNASLQALHHASGKLQGTLGLWTNIENLTIEGDQPLGPNSITTGFAGYAYEEYLIDSETRLQAAVRYDYNRIQTKPFAASTDSVFQSLDTARHTDAVTASFGAIKHLAKGWTGSFSLARSFRAPTVQELFANGLDAPSGTYSIGTDGLESETGFGIDASLKGEFDKVTFEVSPYANYIQHYIYAFLRGDTLIDFPVRKFAATDARLVGVEAAIALQPITHVSLQGNMDYVQAQDTKQDMPLPFTPPLRGLVRGTYQDDMWMATAEGRFAADQTRLGDGDTRTGGYGVLNVGAGLRIAKQGLVHNLSVHCDNLLDRDYRDHLSVVKDFLPQPGRGFRLTYALLY